MRQLHAVPEWGLLLSITGAYDEPPPCLKAAKLRGRRVCARNQTFTIPIRSITCHYRSHADGFVNAHHIDTAAAPGTAKPLGSLAGVKGSLCATPIPTAGILVAATRTSVKLFKWTGGPQPVPSPLATAAGSKPAPPLRSLPFAPAAEHVVTGSIPASALANSGTRKRRGSIIGGGGGVTPAGNPHVCVVSVGWTGCLLRIAVIHRSDVVLHPESDDEPPQTQLGDPEASPYDDSDCAGGGYYASGGSAEADTGYTLSHLFMRPWSGAIVRQVRCGSAPPLDAAGFPTAAASSSAALSRSKSEADDHSGGGAPPGTGTAAGIANVVDLLGGGWTGPGAAGDKAGGGKSGTSGGASSPSSLAAALPVTSWGAAALIVEAEAPPPAPLHTGGYRSRGTDDSDEDVEGPSASDFDDGAGTDTDPTVAGSSVAGGRRRGAGLPSSSASSHRSCSFDSLDTGSLHNDDEDEEEVSASHRASAARACGAMITVAVGTLPPDTLGGDSDSGPTHTPVAGLHITGTALRGDGARMLGGGGVFGTLSAAGGAGGFGGDASGPAFSRSTPQPIPFGCYPVALHASSWFPYLLAGHAEGVAVINTDTGGTMQRLNLPHAAGFAVCPTEMRVRMDVAAGRVPRLVAATASGDDDIPVASPYLPGGGRDAGDDEDAGGSARRPSYPASVAEAVRSVLARPERVFVFTRSGVVALSMHPLVMHVAGLLSRRPPQFEASLALCERGRALQGAQSAVLQTLADGTRGGGKFTGGAGGKDSDDSGSVSDPSGDGQSAGSSRPAAADPVALVGVSDGKIRQIRAHFGYQLFSRGNFGQALAHLSGAREPVRRVLALVPQLLPVGVRITVKYPLRMPVMIDAMLPSLLRPLVPFLLAARRRFRCDTGRVEVEDEEDADERERGAEGGDADARDGAEGGDEEDEDGLGPLGRYLPQQPHDLDGDAGGSRGVSFAEGTNGGSGGGRGRVGDVAGLSHGASFLSATSGASGRAMSTESGSAPLSLLLGADPQADARVSIGDVLSAQARRDATASRHGGAHVHIAQASGGKERGNSVNELTPPTPVLIDTVLLTALLWTEAHLLAENDAMNAPGGGKRGSGVPQTRRMPAAARAELQRVRRTISKLVASPNCIDVREAELQLASFRGRAGPELVALYRGKGLHSDALHVLSADADAALAAMRLLEATSSGSLSAASPAGTGDATSGLGRDGGDDEDDDDAVESALGTSPQGVLSLVAPRIGALAAYLRQLGHPHEASVLPPLRALLTGTAGGVGFLLGLAALIPPTQWLRTAQPKAAAAAMSGPTSGGSATIAGAALLSSPLTVTPYVPATAAAAVASSAAITSLAQTYTGPNHVVTPLEPQAVLRFLRSLQYAPRGVPAAFALHCDARALTGAVSLPIVLPEPSALVDLFRRDGGAQEGHAAAAHEPAARRRKAPTPVSAVAGTNANSSDAVARQAAIVYFEQQCFLAGTLPLLKRGSPAGPHKQQRDGAGAPEWTVNALLALYVLVLSECLTELQQGVVGSAAREAAEAVFSDYRERFTALACTAVRFDAASVLAALPEEGQGAASDADGEDAGAAGDEDDDHSPLGRFSLFRERVLLLRRLGRHDDALRILVQTARDYAAADEYCDQVYSAATASASAAGTSAVSEVGGGTGGAAGGPGSADRDVYIALLRAYIGTGGPSTEHIADDDAAASFGRGLQPLSLSRSPAPRMAVIGDDAEVDVHERGEPPPAAEASSSVGNNALLAALLFGSPAVGSSASAAAPSAADPSENGGSSGSGRGSGGIDSTVATVMEIMTRNNTRVDPTRALAMLPSDLPLSAVAPFLCSSLRHTEDTQKALSITRQLQQTLHFRARTKLLGRQTRRVVVERHTVCAICRRKLAVVGAVGVFAMLPDGGVVHIGCQPAGTGQDQPGAS